MAGLAQTPAAAPFAPGRWPHLEASRRFSLDIESRAGKAFADRAAALSGVATIAFCGSLGRLEAGPESDVDCVVVCEEEAGPDTGAIAGVLDVLGLRPSKPWGIYRRPVTVAQLLDVARLGSLEESAEIFGKRLQLLLDARPVYGHGRFLALRRAVIEWYGTGFLEHAPQRGWTYLINDLMRYLHAYAAWQQYKFDRGGDDSWSLRQAKLRSTRIPTVAALLLLVGESSGMADKQAWLDERLRLTPLERLHAVMTRYDPCAFERFGEAYERCHRILGDAGSRAALIAAGPDDYRGLGEIRSPVLDDIRHASGEVLRTLTTFVLDRRDDWDPRFFERVIF